MDTFQIPISRTQFEAARLRVKSQYGLDIVGDNGGPVKAHGVTVTFIFDETNLNITVKDKPVFVTMDFVEHKITKWFKGEA